MIVRASLALILLLGLPAASTQEPSPERRWAITGGVLIDGTGAPPLASSVIVGLADRITCVGREIDCEIPADAAMVQAAGKWVVPGLIDTHVHLNWNPAADARRSQLIRLAFGTTTTRDAGTPGQLDQTLAARAHADTPEVPEPRLVVSGLVSLEKDQTATPAVVTGVVRRLAASGVDAIKIKQPFSAEALAAIVREAHAHGLPVFGHTWGRLGSFLSAALDADIDGVSHMHTLAEFANRADPARPAAPEGLAFWVWTKELWNYQDEARLREAAGSLLAHGTWLEPMLVTEKHFTFDYPVPDEAAYLGDVRSLEQILRAWLPVGDSGWPARRRRHARLDAVYQRMCAFVRDFHQRGGMVVAGTDNLQPGVALTDEVILLSDCGLTPMAALRAATAQAAVALHLPDRGTVEPGKRADMVLLAGDPLARPGNLRRVWRVVKGGHVHDPIELMRPVETEHAERRRAAWGVRAAGGGAILAVTSLLTVFQRRRRLLRSRSR